MRELCPADLHYSYDFVVSFGGHKEIVSERSCSPSNGPRDLMSVPKKLGVLLHRVSGQCQRSQPCILSENITEGVDVNRVKDSHSRVDRH